MKPTKLLASALLPALTLCATLAMPAKADGLASAVLSVPKRIIVVAVGSTVGFPIALVRCTKRELINRTKEAYELGGVPRPIGYITAGFFGVPSGLICGGIIGTADSIADSVKNSGGEPFNKASLSLDELVF